MPTKLMYATSPWPIHPCGGHLSNVGHIVFYHLASYPILFNRSNFTISYDFCVVFSSYAYILSSDKNLMADQCKGPQL